MKKYFIILITVIVGAFFIYVFRPRKELPPSSTLPPDRAQVVLENIDEYSLKWRNIEELLQAFSAMGYMSVDINGFKWYYYCDHCEGIPREQGHDELVLSSKNLDYSQIEEWCERNKDKYPLISFGEHVEFSIIKQVTDLFHERGLKHYLSPFEDDIYGIRIDLWNQHKPKELPEKPNQKLQPAPLNADDEVKAQGGAAEL